MFQVRSPMFNWGSGSIIIEVVRNVGNVSFLLVLFPYLNSHDMNKTTSLVYHIKIP